MRGMRAPRLAPLLAATSLACGPAPHTRGAGAVSPLSVRWVDWNPSSAPVGSVRAVADAGDVVAVFSDRGATVFSARAPVATDTSIKDWATAGAITGADGAARWIVGVSGSGRMYHLRGLSTFEDVTARYGLGPARVLGVTTLGGGNVGFLLGSEIAIADGVHVSRYVGSIGVTFDELVGGAGFGAVVVPTGVRLFDLGRKAIALYPLPGVTHAAVGAGGRLYASTRRAVYAADSQGRLALVYDATEDSIHGLVASGSAVWFADGEELGVVEGERVAETHGAKIGRESKLASSSSGDVWVLSGGVLSRFARSEGAPSGDPAWASTIAPIFARSCSACHLPDGASGTDLSTEAAWGGERAEILERVVEKRSMPPPGHPLSEEDREAIRRWLGESGGAGKAAPWSP
jgi:cbb3-type cytochrome c oxidase subunit III